MKAADKAYFALRKALIEGTYPPGTRITEQEIAVIADVSRTPVREAMRRLEAEGLLDVVAHQGAFIKAWSDDDAEDIFELRTMLEAFVARRAAEYASPEQLARLRRLAETQLTEATDCQAGYLERIADLNGQFHQTLQDAAASERLKTTLATLTEAPLVLQTFRDYAHEDLVRSAHHHLEIVQALEAGDGSWAATVMRSHVLSARSVFRRESDRHPAKSARKTG